MGKITFALDNHPFKVEVKKDDNEVIKIFEFVTGSKITLGERTRNGILLPEIQVTREKVLSIIKSHDDYLHSSIGILIEMVGKIVLIKDYKNEYNEIIKLTKEIRNELSETENFAWESTKFQSVNFYKKEEEPT